MNSNKLYKIKSYIYDNRPRKLTRYIEKHQMDISWTKLKKNRNFLHYCCKHGSTECLRYLLSVGISGLTVDTDLNTPLHLALNYALWLEQNGKHNLRAECYSFMILPLIEKFPGSLDMRNAEGDTCRRLLHQLVQRQESGNTDKDKTLYSSHAGATADTADDEDDEIAWRDKLADECHHEYQEQWGKHERDYSGDTDEREQYDDWADRIRSEFYTRKRAQEQAYRSAHHTGGKRKHSDSGRAEKDDLENAREKMRKRFDENRQKEKEMDVWKKRMKYEERYKKVLDDDSIQSLCYNEIPWPSKKGTDSDITVLFEGFDKSSMEYKKYLRDQKIRWHPDKFMQRFGRYLVSKEKDTVLQRVTSLSQMLNKLVT